MNNLTKICNRIIEYSFYALFFLVPLTFWKDTSELFEFNKMWLTFGLTILITACWLIKMILRKRIFIQKTPLDIPIVLFLLSQIISTIFSIDTHVSIWGYYSRFNGGLLSIISYILLYYAFLSNFSSDQSLNLPKMVKRSIFITIVSGIIVALWGFPSHFGYDPTCLIFRGNFDVSCWTDAFQPKVRIFSTLGQPDWLGAYLAVLLPVSVALTINKIISVKRYSLKNIVGIISYFLLITLFYLDLLYTQSRSAYIGLAVSLVFFAAFFFWICKKQTGAILHSKSVKLGTITIVAVFIVSTFFTGTSIPQLDKFMFTGLKESFSKKQTVVIKTPPAIVNPGEMGGTDSGKIRLLVWQGAISIWEHNPLFGTGVETFAFSYYKYRPAAHNMVSEWNYLYNKAHNEYLNYLATTGAFGLGSYLLIIGYFLYLSIKSILKSDKEMHLPALLALSLIASYLSILVSNFFGFSVVIINIYFFIIPGFIFVLLGLVKQTDIFTLPPVKNTEKQNKEVNTVNKRQLAIIFAVSVFAVYLIFMLFRFWEADRNYGYGLNLDLANEYQQAYSYLHEAVLERPGEPVFQNEMSVNDAIVAASIISTEKGKINDQTSQIVQTLVKEAIETSNRITTVYPNNVLFWKSRVRIFYVLSEVDTRYLPFALEAIQKAQQLAPTDANVSYNLGVLYGQNNDLDKAIETLNNTVKLKPDYQDAYYALGLFYHQKALDKDGKIADEALQEKAVNAMNHIISHFSNNATAKQALDAWGK